MVLSEWISFLLSISSTLDEFSFVSISINSSWSRRISYCAWRISSNLPVIVNRTAMCKLEKDTSAFCCAKLHKALNPESLLSTREWWRKSMKLCSHLFHLQANCGSLWPWKFWLWEMANVIIGCVHMWPESQL